MTNIEVTLTAKLLLFLQQMLTQQVEEHHAVNYNFEVFAQKHGNNADAGVIIIHVS